MRANEPFLPDDLGALDGLLSRADAVVPMEDIFDGVTGDVIGMRHDCDNVIHPAVRMAEWEAERGYRSTYYVLHTAPYWQDKPLLRESLARISGCGHEIGIHSNALTVALETGRDPAEILATAIAELRHYGYPIRSTVAHGDRLCHIARYVNDEMFAECARADYGSPVRVLEHRGQQVRLRPVPLARFGLEFDSNWLPRAGYLSDSGGKWSSPFEVVAAAWPPGGQLHMLVHPDWWHEAFERQVAA